MSRRTRSLVAAVLLTLTLAACGGDDGSEEATDAPAETEAPAEGEAAGGDGTAVTIKTFDFQPDPVTVAAGTTITFENQDSINHSVTPGTREQPEPNLFEEGVMDAKGDTYELTLEEPGTYAYFCKFHPGEGMTAEIIVE